jgi:hypothetical protein
MASRPALILAEHREQRLTISRNGNTLNNARSMCTSRSCGCRAPFQDVSAAQTE